MTVTVACAPGSHCHTGEGRLRAPHVTQLAISHTLGFTIQDQSPEPYTPGHTCHAQGHLLESMYFTLMVSHPLHIHHSPRCHTHGSTQCKRSHTCYRRMLPPHGTPRSWSHTCCPTSRAEVHVFGTTLRVSWSVSRHHPGSHRHPTLRGTVSSLLPVVVLRPWPLACPFKDFLSSGPQCRPGPTWDTGPQAQAQAGRNPGSPLPPHPDSGRVHGTPCTPCLPGCPRGPGFSGTQRRAEEEISGPRPTPRDPCLPEDCRAACREPPNLPEQGPAMGSVGPHVSRKLSREGRRQRAKRARESWGDCLEEEDRG